MTREEAYKYNETMSVTIPSVNKLIDMIFDDFESRTCENCKHATLLDTDELACESEYMIAEFNTYPQFPLIVDNDFGCNKWESK